MPCHEQVHYLERPCADYVRAAVQAAADIHREDTPGDILIFLTGAGAPRMCKPRCMGPDWDANDVPEVSLSTSLLLINIRCVMLPSMQSLDMVS